MATEGAAGNGLTFENGTYLYGESPQSDTVGAVYFVFQVEANRLSGAIYQPSSSFDCVHGRIGNENLHLTVVDAYEQTQTSYTVAFSPADTQVASTRTIAQPPALEGLHRIAPLSDLDHRLIETCHR